MSCESQQNFCKSSQLASSYIKGLGEEWGSLKSGDLFLKADQWNTFIENIYKAYNYGETANGFDANQNNQPDEVKHNNFVIYDGMNLLAGEGEGKNDADIMYAKMYNGAMKKMRVLASGKPGKDVVKPGDVISATLFNNLSKYARECFNLNTNQCDSCNSSEKCCAETCSETGGCHTPCIGSQSPPSL